MSIIHTADQGSVESMHSQLIDKINDDLMRFQDDAYTMGHARGLNEGDAIRRDLVKALDDLIEVCAPNLYPQPDKPHSPFGKLEAARSVSARAKAVQP